MNFKKMMKRGQEGFTLVELIVVIAILGILGGIAVPAYSGYVEKANKGADQALIGEVQHALALYYYSNPDIRNLSVVLGQEGTTPKVSEDGQKALEAVFGSSWNTLHLKHSDWKGDSGAMSYSNTSYHGKEDSLLNEVDKLTDALRDTLENTPDIAGSGFATYLKEHGLEGSDSTTQGNAAVLYVAQETVKNQAAIQQAIAKTMLNDDGSFNPGFVGEANDALVKECGVSQLAALATIYAMAEGYAQSLGNDVAKDFHNKTTVAFQDTTDVGAAVVAMQNAMFELAQAGPNGMDDLTKYANEKAATDLEGFLGIMGTVNNNTGMVEGNLGADDCFTDGTVGNMLKGYAAMGEAKIETEDGEVAVFLSVVDGVPAIHRLPIDMGN